MMCLKTLFVFFLATGFTAAAGTSASITRLHSPVSPVPVPTGIASGKNHSHAIVHHPHQPKKPQTYTNHTKSPTFKLHHRPVPWSASDPSYNTTVHHFECGTHGHKHGSEHFLASLAKLHAAESASSEGGPIEPLTGNSNSDSTTHPKPPTRRIGSNAARAKRSLYAPDSSKRSTTTTTSPITVPLYIHVVTTHAKSGSIPQSMITAQASVLNQIYNQYGVFFTLSGVDYTANDAWATGADPNSDVAMKTSLRKGTYSSLNLYMQTDLVGGILGRCSLPTNIGTNPSPADYATDGCNIAASTMPGGAILGYNLGMTAVHETGHWLGLLHTFEGYSCSGPGDYISDTAMESESTSGCPTAPWKNSCPRPAGFFLHRKGDPIRNVMDYSTDACYLGFTPGQVSRVRSMWGIYRARK